MSPAVSPTGVPLWDDDGPTDGVPLPRDHDSAAEARAVAIADCHRCDDHGRRLPHAWWPCDHGPEPDATTARDGAAHVREALAAARASADAAQPVPIPPAPHHAPERP